MKAGDVVLEYNGQRVEGMEQFGRMVRETPPGREVKLTISRNGATQTLTAMLGSRKDRSFPENFHFRDAGDSHARISPRSSPRCGAAMLGVEAESLGSQLAEYFGVKEGVLVRSVLENTPAQKAGIKAGDVITKVDGMAVTSPSELSGAVRSASSKKTYTVELMRDRKPQTVTVTVDEGRIASATCHGAGWSKISRTSPGRAGDRAFGGLDAARSLTSRRLVPAASASPGRSAGAGWPATSVARCATHADSPPWRSRAA